jgi:NADH-quinone oxidoreductase subunit F
MADDGILDADSAIRVSFGGPNRSVGRELVSAAQEAASGIVVAEVGSTGVPALEPLVLATADDETALFSRSPSERVETIVESLEEGELPTDGATAVVEHEPGTSRLPTPADGPLSVGTRTVLGACGWAAPTSSGDYPADAFVASESEDSEDAIARVAEAGLRGRGRGDAAADVPIADRWEHAQEASGETAIVINANEADRRAAADRVLLESAPLAVLDGALAAGQALEAANVLVYCNENDILAQERATEAAAVLEDELEEGVSIEVLAGPDEYKAGEATMAIEAIEGNHRLEARLRPPYPSEEGLHGRPTLVHTPRTFAQVGEILADGDSDSTARSTRLFSVASREGDGSERGGDGERSRPTTVELATEEDLSTAREAIEFDDHMKAACVGGVFGGLTRTLDVPARANALRAAGLGTNGVIELFDEEECMVAFAGNRAVFGEEENCGRCVPCREGTQQLTNKLREVYGGEYESEGIRELLRVMDATSICSFGRDASRPTRTAIEKFEVEFRAHANGRCPAGVCK